MRTSRCSRSMLEPQRVCCLTDIPVASYIGCTDGSGVVSGSVSSSEIHFVVNYGPVGYEIDSITGVCEHSSCVHVSH